MHFLLLTIYQSIKIPTYTAHPQVPDMLKLSCFKPHLNCSTLMFSSSDERSFHIFQMGFQVVLERGNTLAQSNVSRKEFQMDEAALFLLQPHPSGTLYLLTLDCVSVSTFKRHLIRLIQSSCAASTSVSSNLKVLYKCVIIIIITDAILYDI